jgi:uncharacterized protein YjbI with pentapeptide repeats
MANPEHLAKLKKGVRVWNEWREEDSVTIAALQGASLCKTNLVEADLRNANLIRADLRGTNLRGTDLERAELIDADLFGANLLGANLVEANLTGANLRGAKYLTVQQLCKAKTLYEAQLDPGLEEQIKKGYADLLEKRKDEE